MKKYGKPAAWQVRKVMYGLVAVIIGVLGYFGIASEVKADEITSQADQWIPWLLGVLAPALAASKTHAGSDSTVTATDVSQAAQAADSTVAELLKRMSAFDPQSIGQNVVKAIREEESGEHDYTPADAEAEYVYGRE